MNELYDIVFVGNTSIDKKKCINKKYVEVIGGSAFNSYCATLKNKSKQNNKIYSNTYELEKFKEIDINKSENKLNVFNIDEINNTCLSEINSEISLDKGFSCSHLHISFRKGVNVESFLSGKIKFKTMSIDVMIFSVYNYLDTIKKYANLIDFIFCNKKEYEILKDIKIKGIFIVTNENKPIELYYNDKKEIYYVPPINNKYIKSTTGAGDSFIGGFLSEYLISEDILQSITNGISYSQLCLKSYTNQIFYKRKPKILKNIFKFPTHIVVIGPSCAGKSTLIKKLINSFDFYSHCDDLTVLKERVELDEGTLDKSLSKYYLDIDINDKKTKKLSNNSFKIIDESLWKEVVKLLLNKCPQYSIIEFSRGIFSKDKDKREEVYIPYIKMISESLIDGEYIVVFIDEPYRKRLKRNIKRAKLGGHKVEDETFNTIYRFSCMPKTKDIVKMKSNYKIKKIINKIGERNGFKRCTKTNMGK